MYKIGYIINRYVLIVYQHKHATFLTKHEQVEGENVVSTD